MKVSMRCATVVILGVAILTCSRAVAQPVPLVPAPFAQPQPPRAVQPAATAPADRPPELRPVEGDPSPMGGPVEAKPARECFRLQMEDGSLILGEIADEAKLTLRAKVGEVEIKLFDVARIDRAVEPNEFQVTLTNGDRLTGRLNIAEVKLQAAWGEVPLAAKGLAALEAGKLFEQTAPESRRSPDGRSVVTIARKFFRFQPTIEGPSAYPTTAYPTTAPGASYPPDAAPFQTHGGVIQYGAPADAAPSLPSTYYAPGPRAQ